eukprot:625921-Rhodomonas_salina.1
MGEEAGKWEGEPESERARKSERAKAQDRKSETIKWATVPLASTSSSSSSHPSSSSSSSPCSSNRTECRRSPASRLLSPPDLSQSGAIASSSFIDLDLAHASSEPLSADLDELGGALGPEDGGRGGFGSKRG